MASVIFKLWNSESAISDVKPRLGIMDRGTPPHNSNRSLRISSEQTCFESWIRRIKQVSSQSQGGTTRVIALLFLTQNLTSEEKSPIRACLGDVMQMR